MKTENKAAMEGNYLNEVLKNKLRKNFNNAFFKMKEEAKEYLDADWNCGFRFMDNGTVICQMFYGSLWVYSKERHFVFGDEDYTEELFEDHINKNRFRHFTKLENRIELFDAWISFFI